MIPRQNRFPLAPYVGVWSDANMKNLIASTLIAVASATFASTNAPTAAETISQQEVVEAALYGKTNVVATALAQGYDVNTRDPDQRTLIMYAAYSSQNELTQSLIAAGADVNAQDATGTTALMFAASGPDTNTVITLLKAGAEINTVDSNEHFTALMWAAAEGQTANVELLLSKGADATLTDIDGDTAESFATKAGHYKAARALKAATKTETPEKTAEE